MRSRAIVAVVSALGSLGVILALAAPAAAATGPRLFSPEQAGYVATGARFQAVQSSVRLPNAANFASEVAGFGVSAQLWTKFRVVVLGVSNSTTAGNYNAAVGHYYLMVDGYLSATSSYTLTVSGGLANSIIPQQKDFVAGKSLVVTSLLQNAPNPFHDNTGIAFSLGQKGHVDLEVFDPRGRLVATLVNQDMNAGPHQVQWVTKTDRGEDVPAGVYFYRLKTLEFVQTRRMVVMP